EARLHAEHLVEDVPIDRGVGTRNRQLVRETRAGRLAHHEIRDLVVPTAGADTEITARAHREIPGDDEPLPPAVDLSTSVFDQIPARRVEAEFPVGITAHHMPRLLTTARRPAGAAFDWQDRGDDLRGG